MDLHNRLIAAFLDPQANLPQIAADAGLSLCQLAEWFHHPGTQAALEELREMARFRAQLLADLGLPAAVQHLEHITAELAALEPGPEAPITTHLRLADTVRRNTTAIQRLATPRPPRAHRGIGILADVRSDRPNADPIDVSRQPDSRARDDPHTAAA